MSNIDVANEFLVKAKKYLEGGNFEFADRYTAMAAVIMQAHMADKVGAVAKAIDRLASVVNVPKSWH